MTYALAVIDVVKPQASGYISDKKKLMWDWGSWWYFDLISTIKVFTLVVD